MLIMDIYLRSIARRWKAEIVGLPATKYVLSPYITSGTAESVLATTSGEPCEIYTLFSAELFSAKASSLKTIKRLASYGHQIFHLPGLHAKIILVPGAFATIGSQNLTLNGTRNKEASVLIKGEKQLFDIEKEVILWLAGRVPITPEMIADMEMQLKDLDPMFEAFSKVSEAADRAVLAKQRQRDVEALAVAEEALRQQSLRQQEALRREALRVEAKRQVEEAQNRSIAEKAEQHRIVQEAALARARNLQRLRSNANRVQTSLATAEGVVRSVGGQSIFSLTPERHSLLAAVGRNFTAWLVDGRQVNLVNRRRYLIIRQNGWLGWARVVNTRITFIEASISSVKHRSLFGYVVSIDAKADWSASPIHGRNVAFEFNFELCDFPSCTVSAWFDLSDLTILGIDRPDYVDKNSKEHEELIKIIRNKWPEFKDVCRSMIIESFVYVDKLTGVDALEFFGEAGTRVSLTAALIGDNPVLLERR